MAPNVEMHSRNGGECGGGGGETVLIGLAAEAPAHARLDSTILIIADAHRRHWPISNGVANLGGRSITVRSPLDAIIGLQDDALAVRTVLAPAHDPGFEALAFFAFMKDTFPVVRRITYAKHVSEHGDALAAGLVDAVLTCPTPRELAEALQLEREAAPRAPRRPRLLQDDERSNQQLLQDWRVSDRRAFDELDQRFRPRIRQLAASLGVSDDDAEDIAQETLLGLFLGRRTSHVHCTPDDFICGLAEVSLLARARGERRRMLLRSALARSAAADRTERECRNQPDEGLLASDLAVDADAAISSLPPGCRRAFWLRAVEGQSAKEAGKMLSMTPFMVDARLLRARRLVADHLREHLA